MASRRSAPKKEMGWIDATMLQARHSRVTLAHAIGEPGSGAPFMDDLDVLDTDAWQLVRAEIIDPATDKAPAGFERIDAALTALLNEVSAARDNLRCFEDPKSARDAWELFDEEVAYDAEFTDALHNLKQALEDVGGDMEKAADAEDENDG